MALRDCLRLAYGAELGQSSSLHTRCSQRDGFSPITGAFHCANSVIGSRTGKYNRFLIETTCSDE